MPAFRLNQPRLSQASSPGALVQEHVSLVIRSSVSGFLACMMARQCDVVFAGFSGLHDG